MQSCKLLGRTIREIERINRRFLWDDKEDRASVHPVAWDMICKPKQQGDLGILTMAHINETLLAKLVW